MISSKALAVLVVGVLILASFSFFTVAQYERAIKFQLGRIVRSDYEPGLHVKVPFMQNVIKFDGRIQNLDSEPELYLTSEKKNVVVDSFVKWRIKDVGRYFTSTGGDARRASDRLNTVVQKRLKDEFGKRSIRDVVSGERAQVMSLLAGSAAQQATGLGIEIADVRIKRIDLPEEVSNSVYERMSAERKELANEFRSRGEESAKQIRAKANREREVMLAEAHRDGQRIRGEGDGKAAETYANAYGEDEEFYALYRSLNAYRDVFTDRSDILVMQPDSSFFKFFNNPAGAPRP